MVRCKVQKASGRFKQVKEGIPSVLHMDKNLLTGAWQVYAGFRMVPIRFDSFMVVL